jgi:hypothetical protein
MTNPNNSSNDQNKLPLSTAAADFLGQILTARYPSELRGFGPKVGQSIVKKQLRPQEVDTVFDAIKAKRESLMVDPSAEPPLEDDAGVDGRPVTAQEQERELDWRERQIPNGDR